MEFDSRITVYTVSSKFKVISGQAVTDPPPALNAFKCPTLARETPHNPLQLFFLCLRLARTTVSPEVQTHAGVQLPETPRQRL